MYLDRSLEDIPLFKNLMILLNGILSNPDYQKNYLTVDDIYKVTHLYDPVRDFIDYYEQSRGKLYSEGHKQFIVNALYACKGTIKVFEMIQDAFEIKVDYKYNFPVIDLIQFESISITNIETFKVKLSNMLYYLLYYTDITMRIINLIFNVNDTLVEYKYKYNENYQIFKFE